MLLLVGLTVTASHFGKALVFSAAHSEGAALHINHFESHTVNGVFFVILRCQRENGQQQDC